MEALRYSALVDSDLVPKVQRRQIAVSGVFARELIFPSRPLFLSICHLWETDHGEANRNGSGFVYKNGMTAQALLMLF